MPTNLLILMADQHTPAVAGCYGNETAHTPNLDRLAARGTVFDAAYTPSPICVPARAAMATGRYVQDIGNWDNAAPFTGDEAPSWGRRASDGGATVTTIGKLHFASDSPATGFPNQLVAMHVKDGGDISHALRGRQPPTSQLRDIVIDAGEGESSYASYDRQVAATASCWLRDEAPRLETPWVTLVSFASPHYPLKAPTEHFNRFEPGELPLPGSFQYDTWDQHERTARYRTNLRFDEPISEARTRRALAAYYGLVSFMDEQAGAVLDALEESGLSESTAVLYVSDHGELLGAHGLWFKGTMHERSVRIPAILVGPGLPSGVRCRTPVSLVDVYPTVLDVLGLALDTTDGELPGRSLRSIAMEADDTGRSVFSEYHSAFAPHSLSMVRWEQWKYVHHVGSTPQLFDVVSDPDELQDLAGDREHADVVREGLRRLSAICDPEAVNRAAHLDQRRRIDERRHELGSRPTLMAFSPPPQSKIDPTLQTRK